MNLHSHFIHNIKRFLVIIICIGLIILSNEAFAKFRFTPATVENRLQAVQGKPAIVMVVQNMDTGQIKPFMFELNDETPFYIYNLNSRQYRVISAKLQSKFGDINNFCHIKRGIITKRALAIHLKGLLVHSLHQMICKSKYSRTN